MMRASGPRIKAGAITPTVLYLFKNQ